MDVLHQATPPAEAPVDTLIIPVFADSIPVDLNEASLELITEHVKGKEFAGTSPESLVLHSPTGFFAKHVIVVGLGKEADFSPVIARKVAASGIQKAREVGGKVVGITLPKSDGDISELAQAITEGLLLGNYQFHHYKTVNKEKLAEKYIDKALLLSTENPETVGKGLAKGEAIATAILNTRDIINEPPSHIKPVTMVKAAEEIVNLSAQMSLKVFDETALREEGYAALLAVASGSEEPPYLIHLHYKPAHAKKSIAFVGKGVTFDSGGLGIKPWAAMLSMKTDMAGGANVLGIFQAIAELEAIGQPIDYEVHGIIPTTENMISGKAMRPDDIIETKSGKTIEIIHTDAEGRLILSDALTYAVSLKPQAIVDFATLTGAAIRALGRSYCAYMGNDRDLLTQINDASQQTGELAWELPLPEEYKKYLESPVADLQNIAKQDGTPDAIYGGLFLQEFVDDTPWVHLDIAGPSWQEEGDANPVYPKGATGYGILLSLKLLEQ
jgi:leucyl aminopeptidase